MSIFQEFCSLKTINNWYSKAIQTGIHYPKCDVTSGQNKKFRLKYTVVLKSLSPLQCFLFFDESCLL